MKLTVAERLTLGKLLPQQGDFLTLKIVRKLREALSFSENELEQLKFQYSLACPKCKQVAYSEAPKMCDACGVNMKPSGAVVWDTAKDPVKDVFMGKKAEEICRQTLETLSQNKKLEEKHFNLYAKFVGDEGEE